MPITPLCKMVFMEMQTEKLAKVRARRSAVGFSAGGWAWGGVLAFFTKMRCRLAVLVLVSLLAAACGGDGGSAPEGVSDASPASSAAQGAAASDTATSGTAASDAATPDADAPSTSAPDTAETGDDSDSPSADALGEGRSPGGTSAEGSASEDAESPSTTSPSTDSSSTTSGIQETSDELEALYADELDELIEATERLRGLEFLRPPKFLLLDWDNFDDSLRGEQTEETLEINSVWETVYKLLGLLDPDDSLLRYLTGEGIAGFYDGITERVIVPLSRAGMTVFDRSVLFHELVHALTDQHFNWSDPQLRLFQNNDIDEFSALRAVVEGDAVESTKRYVEEEFTLVEKTVFENLQNSEGSDNSASDSSEPIAVPRFLIDFTIFPYDDGSKFLRSIAGYDEDDPSVLDDEDFQQVNDLYINPPASTEQIYYSEKYPSDAPLEVEHLTPKLTGYELLTTRDWGMLGFVAVFDQILGSQGPSRPAVAGWGGDRFSLWHKGEEVALALTYRGDEAADTEEMATAMKGYIALVTGEAALMAIDEYPIVGIDENFLWLSVEGDTLRLIVASEREAGEELADFYSSYVAPVSSVPCQMTDSYSSLISSFSFFSSTSPTSASSADSVPVSSTDSASRASSSSTSSPASSASASDDSAAASSAVASDDLTEFYEDELNEIVAATERIRGLKFLCEPKVVFLSRASLLERYIGEPSEGSFRGIDASGALQVLLGLVKPDVSPRQLQADRVRAFVGAFYNPETREVVVPISAAGISRNTRLSLVHELVHALTDQHFNFRDTRNYLYANNGDQFLAFSAVIEGDANETTDRFSREEQALLNRASQPLPQSSNLRTSTAVASTPRSAIPQFLRDISGFPYAYGSTFWHSLVSGDEAGLEATGFDEVSLDETGIGKLSYKDWQAVNSAYTNPPASTEQVYFPEGYLSDVPLEVDHPVAELSGYGLIDTDTWGAISFTAMFDQVLGREGPSRPAVEGWGGDRYSYWFNGSEVAMALTYRGDEASDAEELAEALSEYISAAMNAGDVEVSDGLAVSGDDATSGDTTASGDQTASDYTATWSGEDFAWLQVAGDTLRFVVASDPEAGAELVAFYGAVQREA